MQRRTISAWSKFALLFASAVVVSMGSLEAQDSSARVVAQQGQVSISSGGYFKALSIGDQVAARQLIVTGPDGFAKLEVLSDHSTFEVYPNSKVIYRETPGSWQHLLNVFLGHVKVFIQHAPGVANPNNVTSPIAVISVRGTIFDVVVQDEDTTFVTLDEGIVDVRNLSAAGNSVTLKPTESITVYRNIPLVARGIDKGGALRKVVLAARDTIYQIGIRRPAGGVAGPVPGSTGGAQGDKGKDTGTTPTSGPGAPPAGPSAPPAGPSAPPGGPGGD